VLQLRVSEGYHGPVNPEPIVPVKSSWPLARPHVRVRMRPGSKRR